MEDPKDDLYVQLDLDIEDVHSLYQSVCFHLEKWPGGNPEEQQHLIFMKDFLYRIVLEYKYEHMN
mgnify:CR=1 FL=1